MKQAMDRAVLQRHRDATLLLMKVYALEHGIDEKFMAAISFGLATAFLAAASSSKREMNEELEDFLDGVRGEMKRTWDAQRSGYAKRGSAGAVHKTRGPSDSDVARMLKDRGTRSIAKEFLKPTRKPEL